MIQKEAHEYLKEGKNIFLTGEAGTGKTHLLNEYIKYLKKKKIPYSVTATTGIAATHLGGTTIDSWSGMGISEEITPHHISEIRSKKHIKERLLNTRVLIIDEISMMSGKKLDFLNDVLKGIRQSNEAFGGVQIVLCGDFFQLPPVDKENRGVGFAFESKAWREGDFTVCYLDHPYRQNDPRLLMILKGIRRGVITQDMIDLLYLRTKEVSDSKVPARLFTHNVDVDRLNEEELSKIREDNRSFMTFNTGPEKLTSFLSLNCLAPAVLNLKKKAIVMFVRNSPKDGYVNGTMGVVSGFNDEGYPIVKTYDGKTIEVFPSEWSIKEGEKIIAAIRQVPLRLAWAITVHKSQGMTLSHAEIDLSKAFIPGMGYVALSRVRSLDTLYLKGINEMALRVNEKVMMFDEELRRQSSQASLLLKKDGAWGRFWKRWKATYKLTS